MIWRMLSLVLLVLICGVSGGFIGVASGAQFGTPAMGEHIGAGFAVGSLAAFLLVMFDCLEVR